MRPLPKLLVLLCFFIGYCNAIYAQTQRIDSLRQQLVAANNPRAALNLSLLLLAQHESLCKDSLMPLVQHTLVLAKQQNDKRALGYAYVGLINAFLRLGDSHKADSVLQKISPEYNVKNPELAPIGFLLREANVNMLGAKSDYESAVKELFNIIHDAEKVAYQPALARSFNELGVISYNRNELGKAMEYYNKVLSLGDNYPFSQEAHAYAYINMGMVHAWQEYYDSALYYINLAKPICKRVQNLYYLANAYLVEANVYKWSKRMPQAESAMLKMVELREKTEGHLSFSNEQLGLANFYVYAKNFEKAITIYNEGLAYIALRNSQGIPTNYELQLRYYEGLAKCYSSIGDKTRYEETLLNIMKSRL